MLFSIPFPAFCLILQDAAIRDRKIDAILTLKRERGRGKMKCWTKQTFHRS